MGRELEGVVKAADLLFAFVSMKRAAAVRAPADANGRGLEAAAFLER